MYHGKTKLLTLLLALASANLMSSVDPACIPILMAKGATVTSGRSIAFDSENVVYDPAGVVAGKSELQIYSRLHVAAIPAFESVRYCAISDGAPACLPKNAKLHAVLFHGHLGVTSHGGSWFKVIPTLSQTFRSRGSRGKGRESEPSLTDLLKETDYYRSLVVGAEAPDSPLHGAGSSDWEKYRSLENTVEWYVRYLEHSASEVAPKGARLVVMARSSAAGILLAAIKRYPERLKPILAGVVVLGLFHPRAGYSQSLEILNRSVKKEDLNPLSYRWITENIYPQMIQGSSLYDWSIGEDPLAGIPILALYGENDLESPPEMRAAVEKMVLRGANKQPLSRFGVIRAAGHDMLKPEPPKIAFDAWREIYAFFGAIGK